MKHYFSPEEHSGPLTPSPSETLKEELTLILKEKRLPQPHYDRTFKMIFDSDLHPQRVEKIFSLLFHKELQVLSSMKEETPKASLHSKKTIADVLSKMEKDIVFDMEMSKSLHLFFLERMDIYASDLVMLQFSVEEKRKKTDFSYGDIPPAFLAVFLKESPHAFKDRACPIHYRTVSTDTGAPLPSISNVVYVELDKCAAQWRDHTYPPQEQELYAWMTFLSDVNTPQAAHIASQYPELQEICMELGKFSKSREELMNLLVDEFDEIVRRNERRWLREQALREGWEEGIQKGTQEGMQEGMQKGMQKGMQEGMQKGMQEGMQLSQVLFTKLIVDLNKDNRLEDLSRIGENPLLLKQLLEEYDLLD